MRIKPSRLPNLLVIGAPRCGTTSLHDWLVAHPQIAGAARKETFFLMDPDSFEYDERCNVRDQGLEGYAALFDQCAGASVRIESTTGYLYQGTALDILPDLAGEPRFVVVLRDPAQRVLSTFRYFQGHKGQVPREFTFRRFVDAIDSADASIQHNEFLGRAIDHSRYAVHLARWRERVPRNRMRVLVFEDLRRNAAKLVPEIVAWCGLDAGFYASYAWPHRNESYDVRFPRAHALTRAFVLPWVRSEKIKRALRGMYVSMMGRKAVPPDDDEMAVLQELRTRFAADNSRLEEEWGLDLSSWSAS